MQGALQIGGIGLAGVGSLGKARGSVSDRGVNAGSSDIFNKFLNLP